MRPVLVRVSNNWTQKNPPVGTCPKGSNWNLEMDIAYVRELGQFDSDWRHIDPPYICLLQVHQMGSH